MEGAREYEVALSFAGSERAYAAAVAEALRVAGVRTFYDEYKDEAVRLWGLDLAEEFHRIYSEASSVVVMFVSSEYRDRMWTRHERRSAIERALRERREYILPVQFDATQLPGISANIGYLASSAVTPEQLAERIQQKIVAIGGRIPAHSGATDGWLADGANRVPGTTTVQVLDASRSPVVGAQVALVRANETASFASTDTAGTASIMLPGREMVTAWIAHPDFRAAVVDSHDSASDLTVHLIQKPGYSSHIFETSTGYLPDFEGRLAPISDGPRRYFHGDNIAANGTAANPAFVELDVPLAIEDRQGRRRLLTFRGLTGHQSLLEVATHSA